MTVKPCLREEEIARVARLGNVSEAVRAHARECRACRETLAAASALSSLASVDDVDVNLPDSRIVWLKSQLVAPASVPPFVQRSPRAANAVWAAVVACWATFLVWRWNELQDLLTTLSLSRFLASGASVDTFPIASIAVVGAMAIVTFAIMFHQVLADDM